MSTDKFEHVMVDIETMSLHKHKALILSVGMLEFDPSPEDAVLMGQSVLITPVIMPQIMLGRRVDPGTQKFWADEHRRDPRSSDHFLNAITLVSLDTMINQVREFCQDRAHVWANGTQFDLSNLDGLAEDIGDPKELWHYRAPRDMRTFDKTNLEGRSVPLADALDIPGVLHNPVYDCMAQAWRVWSKWRA
jgi:3' exoribonuclease, RNase T-like